MRWQKELCKLSSLPWRNSPVVPWSLGWPDSFSPTDSRLTQQLVDPWQRCWWTDGLVLCLTNCVLMWFKLYVAVKRGRRAIMTVMLILECLLLIVQSWLGISPEVNHLLGYWVRSLPVQDHCCTKYIWPMDASFVVMLITYSIQQDISLWFKLIQTVGTMFRSQSLSFLMDQLSRKIFREYCLNILREPDDPRTDTLRNERGKCEEQLNIALIVFIHSMCIVLILHFLFVHLLVRENQLFIVLL